MDDIVFDTLGLTQEERNEVYWAVYELVRIGWIRQNLFKVKKSKELKH